MKIRSADMTFWFHPHARTDVTLNKKCVGEGTFLLACTFRKWRAPLVS